MEPRDLKELLHYLDKSELWWHNELLNSGVQYLEWYFESTPELVPLYSYHKAYWVWYSRQFNRRAQMLLIYCRNRAISVAEANARFNNRISAMTREIYPNRAVSQIIMKAA